jgi:Cache 3/Cache 2 fusion domain
MSTRTPLSGGRYAMRPHQVILANSKALVGAVGLMLALALTPVIHEGSSARAAARVHPKIEASIFSFDGKDFIRTSTTLMKEDGKSAVNTKLDHDSPAYKALTEKHSYSGDATVFGHKYEANYAPLTAADGHVTGALFVGVAK